MLLFRQCLLLCLLFISNIHAQVVTPTGSNKARTSIFNGIPANPSYQTPSTRTLITSTTRGASSTTGISSGSTRSSQAITILGLPTTAPNETETTSSSTATAALPTNTQPCNNYVELCNRKYSNVTEVCAHNSPFIAKNNAARNQELGVTAQLNDGIRMLQGQVHFEKENLYYCHSSCDLLNAGTVEAYLTEVATWVKAHPYDVVSIIFGNADQVDPKTFVPAIQKSGLEQYAYRPPVIPMRLDNWPTLGEMILNQQRVVFFIDYKANQDDVPYILDEFSQLWETPFSPTNRDFPCDVNRPPGLSDSDAKDRLYMANHNLNVEISIAGISILVPSIIELILTNAFDGYGSLGAMAETCTRRWDRPPNFLLVDFYNTPKDGSVFKVAAEYNGVTYNRSCCSPVPSAAVQLRGEGFALTTLIASTVTLFSVLLLARV